MRNLRAFLFFSFCFVIMTYSQVHARSLKGVRGSFLYFTDDPFYVSEADSYRYIPDGLLVTENGHIKELDSYSKIRSKYPHLKIDFYPGALIVPGFVDTHIHFPQTGMIASYGDQLLEWLNKYTFPAEKRFYNQEHAQQVASFFVKELLRNGTTSALVFGSVHSESVDALFAEAKQYNMRIIAGKVLMDRKGFAPDFLRDSPESGYAESKALIQKWHGQGRSLYAITPRFAITSTEEQLRKAGQLKKEYPDVYLQTHLSENKKEIETVASLFPDSKGYLDVYDRFGLLGDKSIFAHGVHLRDDEFKRLSETHSAISFCPTSNLFLGSGLFRLSQAKSTDSPVRLGLGTDVGAGTSFSLLQTINEAYKVAQLQGQKLSAFKALYLATLGGAKALSLDHQIGSFDPGKEADFVVLSFDSTALQAFRMSHLGSDKTAQLHEKLFSLVTLGDDRAVLATYVYGQLAYRKKNN